MLILIIQHFLFSVEMPHVHIEWATVDEAVLKFAGTVKVDPS